MQTSLAAMKLRELNVMHGTYNVKLINGTLLSDVDVYAGKNCEPTKQCFAI